MEEMAKATFISKDPCSINLCPSNKLKWEDIVLFVNLDLTYKYYLENID